MADKRPLVSSSGVIKELPASDTLVANTAVFGNVYSKDPTAVGLGFNGDNNGASAYMFLFLGGSLTILRTSSTETELILPLKFSNYTTNGVLKVTSSNGTVATEKIDIFARVTHSAAQSIANATFTALAFNTERNDTGAIHDTVTNNSRLTCVVAGKYLAIANIEFAGTSGGTLRILAIRINGSLLIAAQTLPPLGASVVIISVSTLIALSAGDYLEAVVYQDSGGALNVNATAAYSPEFEIQKIL